MIKISHEAPLCLLEESLKFNDYQYLLPYFWDRFPKYKEFMLNYSRQKDSFIILDNGLFEGEVPSNMNLLKIIKTIEPDIFIVPDEWNDSIATYRNAKYWKNIFEGELPSKTKLMVVLQGNTFNEISELYTKCVDLGYTHFAVNHSSNFYQLDSDPTLFVNNQVLGRISLIESLVTFKIMKKEHYIHLLGASLVGEFGYYRDFLESGWINSIDTSNPIIAGILKQKYEDDGLKTKPKQKMEEFFTSKISSSQKKIIEYNINKFKQIVNGKLSITL